MNSSKKKINIYDDTNVNIYNTDALSSTNGGNNNL